MSPSKMQSILIIICLILILPSSTRAQAPGDSSRPTYTVDSARTPDGHIQDTLSVESDTTLIAPDSLGAKKDTVAVTRDTLDIITSTESLNTIPGFRVQIGSTQDLSAAVAERAKAETILTDFNVYIIYDSPYYKVRAGDFRARYDATQAANQISTRGFSEAWVVPDNVFKNPVDRHRDNR